MPGLVLEGGTFRPIFSAGVMDALLDEDIMFPYCIGVSAGITDGFSYASRQKERNLKILQRYRNDKRYLGAGNLLKDKSIFGVEFVFEEIPNNLLPFDWESFARYEGDFRVGVTNAKTGQIEYLDGKELDQKNTMVKATCAIPMVFPVVKLNGNEYYDGGICDPIPVRKAQADGHDKLLIVLTRPQGYIKESSKANAVAAKLLCKKYPSLVEPLLTRHIAYNETVQYCEALEREGKAIILRPAGEGIIDSFEKDVRRIETSYQYGYDLCKQRIEEIRALFP
ncbi:MAG: patatin family protein [Peptococcaceae bacterium]|jgi:predicted patatin/cPLA2 family phospholipase|nr:patatin family protein [Peptococcaceae bacterium]MBQ2431935.1 patatin family protein [Peptococcaceae bacterium]MBQ5706810.1 patatin family protein [Peptococcaceae bacterium]